MKKFTSILLTTLCLSTLLIVITRCKDDPVPKEKLPVVTTLEVNLITPYTARSGGVIFSDGGSEIKARGLCWSESGLPTIEDHVILDESEDSTFIAMVTGLKPESEYNIRAFATNSDGTSYGYAVLFISTKNTFRVIHKIDLQLKETNDQKSVSINIDENPESEFRIEIGRSVAPSGASFSFAKITPVNPFYSISSYVNEETKYLSETVSLGDGAAFNKKVAIVKTITQSCQQINYNDRIQGTSEITRVKTYRQEQVFNPDGTWYGQAISFYDLSYSSSLSPTVLKQNKDTIWLATYMNTYDCIYFPQFPTCIVVRSVIAEKARIGFIRLQVTSDKISISDSEMQL